jgi:murein DD-endopeptidase MepM/ murein hydrolase activator NlpD
LAEHRPEVAPAGLEKIRRLMDSNTFFKIFLPSLMLCGVLSGDDAVARKLYKYQDAQGRWHYTDRKPDHVVEVETSQLRISRQKEKVAVIRRGVEAEPTFFIINEYRGPVEVELSLNKSQNIVTTPALPKRFIVPAASEIRAMAIRPQQRGSWQYQTRYRYMLGDPRAEHRPERPYRVPFAVGTTFPVSQGFRGRYSHTTPSSEFAVDIAMPEGTDIHAARDGIVMDVSNDFFSGGTDSDKFMDRANLIRILHDDGTMAVYGHLRLESAQVSVGARVQRGQRIGQSGNTGYSSGPHLHFVIQKNSGLKMISVPFEFAGADNRAIVPQQGTRLTAVP